MRSQNLVEHSKQSRHIAGGNDRADPERRRFDDSKGTAFRALSGRGLECDDRRTRGLKPQRAEYLIECSTREGGVEQNQVDMTGLQEQ